MISTNERLKMMLEGKDLPEVTFAQILFERLDAFQNDVASLLLTQNSHLETIYGRIEKLEKSVFGKSVEY